MTCSVTGQDQKKEEKTKKGWNFGALPVISYNSDLGFQYGALANFYDYGNGAIYPDYRHSIYFEISRYTKGSGINKIAYDSKYLIPGIRLTCNLNYYPDLALDFFGFNGYRAKYNCDWEDEQHNDYISRMFYKLDRKRYGFECDFQGKIYGEYLRWLTGLSVFKHTIGTVNIDKLNKGKSDKDKLPETKLLYDKYVDWGIIGEKEKNGGFNSYLKAGIIFDTRDIEANPMKGLWSEILINAAPGFLGNDNFDHLRIALIHRQYFTLIPKKLSLVYRIHYEAVILGNSPFYLYPYMMTSFAKNSVLEGIGGAKSLRGVIRNRVQSKAYLFLNIELRWKILKFAAINQNFYLALSAFFDSGKVVKERRINYESLKKIIDNEPGFEFSEYFDNKPDGFHSALGLGLHLAMNQNFIIAVDYGRPLDNRDGTQGFYIGLNFLF